MIDPPAPTPDLDAIRQREQDIPANYPTAYQFMQLRLDLRALLAYIAQLTEERDSLKAALDAREQLVIDQVKSHWFCQGGQAQFGAVTGSNADEIVSRILSVVRKQFDAAEAKVEALEGVLRQVGEMVSCFVTVDDPESASVFCEVCERNDGHFGWCVVPKLFALLALPAPVKEQKP